MHRKEVTHSDGSYEKKSHRRAWLKKWGKVKSHATVIDWCTGREWPVNCMIVISAWWQSNMPFQRFEWGMELLYNSVKTGSQLVWRSDQLVRRFWNENMSQRGWAPRPPLEQPRRTRTIHGDVRRGWGGHYVAVFVRSPTPSYTQTLQ